jgi:hypothetical protein
MAATSSLPPSCSTGLLTLPCRTTKVPKVNVTFNPAAYPFSVGFVGTVCVPSPSKSNPLKCTNKFQTVGAATVTCANGTLNLAYESAPRYVIGRAQNVVATCANSRCAGRLAGFLDRAA